MTSANPVVFDLPIVETRLFAGQDEVLVSTDKRLLDLDVVHAWLHESPWAKYLAPERLRRAVERSLCVGAYRAEAMIGFARMVTDFSTFGYFMDVYVAAPHRRRGIGQTLLRTLLAHPSVADIDHFALLTPDAHRLYEPLGFRVTPHPWAWMERYQPRD